MCSVQVKSYGSTKQAMKNALPEQDMAEACPVCACVLCTYQTIKQASSRKATKNPIQCACCKHSNSHLRMASQTPARGVYCKCRCVVSWLRAGAGAQHLVPGPASEQCRHLSAARSPAAGCKALTLAHMLQSAAMLESDCLITLILYCCSPTLWLKQCT